MLHYIKEILTNQIIITNNICSIVYLNVIQSPSPIILSCQFLQTNVAGLWEECLFTILVISV